MRATVTALALALAAGCASSSGGQQLSAADPSTIASPVGSPKPTPSDSPGPATSAAASPAGGNGSSGSASSGPGRLSSPPPSPSPRPTPSPVAGTVTVTDDDSGSTVRLVRGQRLRIRLSQGTWDPPVSSSGAVVVRRTSSGGYPSDQPVDATFDAVGRGNADVAAQSDAACFHTEPRCMMASRQWQVHVTVS